VTELTDRLRTQRKSLELADIRSLAEPLGLHVATAQALQGLDVPKETAERALRQQALTYYTTDLGGRKHVGTRLDLVLERNPFTQKAIADLDRVEDTLRQSLPPELREGTEVYVFGPTASIRDLSHVAGADHWRIAIRVLVVVFVILVLLLRQPLVSLYLVGSVLFSYYATIGVTYLIFWAFDPANFPGLDWKVSTFLFTILIAVGEDYNIFLMARVHEEQRRHGPFRGILCAMTRTGPIISSCGIIMAGTFASLLAGSLSEMKQLGFALSFGVLLDTFVVRPVLVPSFLVLREKFLHRGETPVDVQTPEATASRGC
jgi:RND superfamily putative drug exporter